MGRPGGGLLDGRRGSAGRGLIVQLSGSSPDLQLWGTGHTCSPGSSPGP